MKYIFLPLLLFSISVFGFTESSENIFLGSQPSSLISLSNRSRYIFISELETGLLHIYEKKKKNRFKFIDVLPISIGKKGFGKLVEGDDKTPVGVYRITSHLTNKQLDDFYGKSAYPINYPNAWDKLNKRTGFGIWLHAEPIGFTDKMRPLLDSNGCVVLSNNDIEKIKPYIDVGYTYLILTPRIAVQPIETIDRLRETIKDRFASWKESWQQVQKEKYFNYYSEKFSDLSRDKEAWIKYKKSLFKDERFSEIKVSNVSLFNYPNEKNLIWIEYYQNYKSNNYKSIGWKQQLWRLEEDNRWRIIYEGNK